MQRSYGYVNGYTCERCWHQTVTIDRDEGVTPFLIRCTSPGPCRGMAKSAFYRVPTELGVLATHEWYRPSVAEQRSLDAAELDHVARGGLLMRAIDPANRPEVRSAPAPPSPVSANYDQAAADELRAQRALRKAEAWARRQPKGASDGG